MKVVILLISLIAALTAQAETEPTLFKYSCRFYNFFHPDQRTSFTLALAPHRELTDLASKIRTFHKNDLVKSTVQRAYSSVLVDKSSHPDLVTSILGGSKSKESEYDHVFYVTVGVPNSKNFVVLNQGLDDKNSFELKIQRGWRRNGIIAATKITTSMKHFYLAAYDKDMSIDCQKLE